MFQTQNISSENKIDTSLKQKKTFWEQIKVSIKVFIFFLFSHFHPFEKLKVEFQLFIYALHLLSPNLVKWKIFFIL